MANSVKPIAFFTALLGIFSVTCVYAAEEEGEHAKKKPEGKPGLPVAEVMKLGMVKQWKDWEEGHKKGYLMAWGETLTVVEDQKCWGVALGETRNDGMHVWRHFCVPVGGGDVYVEKISAHPEDDTVYLLYDKWVSECKPTAQYQGDC